MITLLDMITVKVIVIKKITFRTDMSIVTNMITTTDMTTITDIITVKNMMPATDKITIKDIFAATKMTQGNKGSDCINEHN